MLCIVLSGQAFGQPVNEGDWVVVIADPAKFKAGSKAVDTAALGTSCTVSRIKNGWYWVRGDSDFGWIHSSHVIPKSQAIPYFSEVIRRAPTARNFAIRARLRSLNSEHRLAIADFNEAIRRAPTDAQLYSDRGLEWSLTGEVHRAIADFGEAIQLEPNNPSHRVLRAFRWMKLQDYKSAIEDYQEIIRLDPDNATAHADLGRALCNTGDGDGAIAAFTEAIRLDAEEVTGFKVYLERALIWSAKGREDLADADFDQAIRQTKNNPWLREFPFWVRANLRLENGRYADALADCEAIIGLNSAQSGGYALAAWILATCPDASFRDDAKAVDYATKSIKLMRSHDKSERNAILAAAYAEMGRFDEAVRSQKKAIESAPQGEKDRFKHALTLYESGLPFRDDAPSQPFWPKFGFDSFVQ